MAIRIDENTIFEDGRMKKVSEGKAKPKAEAETKEEPKTEEAKEEPKVEAETEEEPKTEVENEDPKTKAGRKPKAPIKGKEA
jgi:hypothetical protein